MEKQEIKICQRDYKALLKFRTFVKTYYPNCHICPKCGELVPEHGICFHCYAKSRLELPEKIGLVINNPNSIENQIKQLNALIKYNQTCNGKENNTK